MKLLRRRLALGVETTNASGHTFWHLNEPLVPSLALAQGGVQPGQVPDTLEKELEQMMDDTWP